MQLEGDEELLRRVMMNLLDNAIRYSPVRRQRARYRQRHDESATVTVEDSGPGIPAAERDRIFERFVRLAPGKGASGSGLGLPIARWIAEQHHGSLCLDGVGHGTRFVMSLPIKPPIRSAIPPRVGQPSVGR